MAFDLPPELAELQATVRKLAQEKVAPRAREIDVTATYPQDLFELFRDTGPARPRDPGGVRRVGRRHPRPHRRHGRGREVLQHRGAHAAAHPPADRPGADRGQRGAEAALRARRRHRRACAPGSGSPSRRPAATSWACAPRPSATATTGCSTAPSAGCRASCRPTGTACSPRPARPTRARTPTSRASSSSARRRVFPSGAPTTRWACAASTPAS